MFILLAVTLVMSSPPRSAAPPPWPPTPVAAGERALEREAMVRTHMAAPRDGRPPVRDPRVLAAMRAVPRHAFMPAGVADQAYRDAPAPIGFGQTISQPYIVALMTELLDLSAGEKVLEIGTGSGYQAAVLAHLTPHVYSIEIVAPIAERAAASLTAQGYGGVHLRIGDGYAGWPEEAPFDAIVLTAAPESLPEPLWQQLAPGGRLVVPLGPVDGVQQLQVLEKGPEGQRRTRTIMGVRFVPMTGAAQGVVAPPPNR